MRNTIDESKLAEYGASVDEQGAIGNSIEMPIASQDVPYSGNAIGNTDALREAAADKIRENQEKSIMEAREEHMQAVKQAAIDAGTAFYQIRIEDLPSKGMFYPEGTRIFISAATLGDIKRWTSMEETDAFDISEKMENILESCCKISFPAEVGVRANWKDIIDMDRLYLILAIHDYSFKPGVNDIRIKLDEKTDTILHKENIRYMQFSDKIMKFYNERKRCFSFPVRKTEAFKRTDGKMDIYITNLGVGKWLYEYIRGCEQRGDVYDKDFLGYAAMLIPDWRGLDRDSYYKLMEETDDWGTYEWSLISKVKQVLTNSSQTTTIVYKDDGGVEREAPLNFRDGFKSIFQSSLDIDL